MIRPGDIYRVKNNNIDGFNKGEIFLVVQPVQNGYEILYYPMSSVNVWVPRERFKRAVLSENQIDVIARKTGSLERCLK